MFEESNILTVKTVTFLVKYNLIKPIFHKFKTKDKFNNIITPDEHKSVTQSYFLEYTSLIIYNNLPCEISDYTNHVITKLNLTNWFLQQASKCSYLHCHFHIINISILLYF